LLGKQKGDLEMIDNYYKRKIYPFVLTLVDNFVDQNGFAHSMDLSDLSDSEINDFTALLLGSSDSDLSVLSEEPALFSVIRAALKSSDTDEDLILSDEIKKLVIKRYSPEMEKIISQVHSEYVANYCDYNDITKKIDLQTGEIYFK
jgi:hypothetical protein